jgi:hypothetical protein
MTHLRRRCGNLICQSPFTSIQCGTHGLAMEHAVPLESAAKAAGLAVWQIGTTPIRIFTIDIPEFYAAGRSGCKAKGAGRMSF